MTVRNLPIFHAGAHGQPAQLLCNCTRVLACLAEAPAASGADRSVELSFARDKRHRDETPAVRRGQDMAYTIKVNGTQRTLDVDGDMPLLWALRDELDLKGTKFGCGAALCGACTVHLDGDPVRSCSTPISAVGTAAVTTIEGIGDTPTGRKVQAAWLAVDVVQCGYCQAGQIMSATALLNRTPHPTDSDIDDAMTGNLCRCATYTRIRAAIKQAADMHDVEAQ